MKALVWKEEYQGRQIGQIERIGEDQEIESWTSYLKDKMEVVSISTEIEDVESQYFEAVTGEDGSFAIQVKDTADVDRRNAILNRLRQARKPLLEDADVEINKIEDAKKDSADMRAYRQELRDVLQDYIKVDGDPKVSADTINIDSFKWPKKP